MDPMLFQLMNDKIDRLEGKVDRLLEFKWQVVGGTILASLIMTGLFQLIVAYIQWKK